MHQSQNGEVRMTKKDILDRWTEYFQELFDDDRAEMLRITEDVTGPEILADEVRYAIKKLKKTKRAAQIIHQQRCYKRQRNSAHKKSSR